jgi:hypothetical protein
MNNNIGSSGLQRYKRAHSYAKAYTLVGGMEGNRPDTSR